jgi:hypothetical protein
LGRILRGYMKQDGHLGGLGESVLIRIEHSQPLASLFAAQVVSHVNSDMQLDLSALVQKSRNIGLDDFGTFDLH